MSTTSSSVIESWTMNGPRCHAPLLFLFSVMHIPGFPASALGQGTRTSPEFSAEELAAYHSIPQDSTAGSLAAGKHFLASNEKGLERFFPHVRGLGGVYVGVGTDQNYLLAGWMRPELLFVMDFDPWVIQMHHLYRLAFLHARSPGEFYKLWTPKGVKKIERWIIESDAPPASKETRLQVLRQARWKVYWRLRYLKRKYARTWQRSFLNNSEQYNHLRAMHRTNRVIALCGNYVGRKTLKGIVRTVHQHRRIIRVFYLSNSEDYFCYRRVFREAVAAMPVDSRSLVLRTIYWKFKSGKIWAYVVQGVAIFNQWLQTTDVRRLHQIVPRAIVRKNHVTAIVFNRSPPRRRPQRAREKKIPQKTPWLMTPAWAAP